MNPPHSLDCATRLATRPAPLTHAPRVPSRRQNDDAKLAHIEAEYSSGRMLSGEIKMKLVECITPLVLAHQKARAAVTDDTVRAFMSVRKMVV